MKPFGATAENEINSPEEEFNMLLLLFIVLFHLRKHRKQLKSAFSCSNTYADTLAWQLNISYIVSQRIKSPLGGKEEFSV